MIEFYGRLSEKAISLASKRKNKCNGIIVFFMATLPCACFTVLFRILLPSAFIGLLILLILLSMANMGMFFVPAKSIVFRLPRRIVIENGMLTLTIEGLGNVYKPRIELASSVNKIIDQEECYIVVFGITNFWICQKSLISKGSVEQFEKLFEGKLVRKI